MPKANRTNQHVERPQGNSNTYEIIPEGYYFGAIRKVKWEEFSTNAGYNMEKFTPTVELFNANRTRIDRQDLTIGAVDSDGNYTNEFFNNPDASIIFGGYDLDKGNYGARNFMFVTGMLNNRGTVVFNEHAIVDMIVKVRVKTRSFVHKGKTYHENVIVWWAWL